MAFLMITRKQKNKGNMYEYCHMKERVCAFATKEKEVLYCGFQNGENRLNHMKKCPLKVKKGRDSRLYKNKD